MRHRSLHLLGATLLLALAACAEETITGTGDPLFLIGAFDSALFGFENTPSSFDPASALAVWLPAARAHMGRDTLAGPGDRPGKHHPGGMMGGIGDPFRGGVLALGFGRGHFGDGIRGADCPFSAATGRLECPPATHHGLTVTRSVAYTNAQGAVQQKYDSATTNAINTRVAVTGSLTHRGGATTTVSHSGERTVAGLAQGSATRAVNGAAAGRETTTGTDSTGAFTVVRTAGDTIRNVVIPVASGMLSAPASGTVTRVMQVTVTRAGQSPATSSRREVITYNGSDSAQVVITKDGTATTCKLPLGHRHGRPRCS